MGGQCGETSTVKARLMIPRASDGVHSLLLYVDVPWSRVEVNVLLAVEVCDRNVAYYLERGASIRTALGWARPGRRSNAGEGGNNAA